MKFEITEDYINKEHVNYDDRKIESKEIGNLIEQENYEFLLKSNITESQYPKDKTIQKLFEEQVEKTPNKAAVVYGKIELTYKELNEKANSLARVLIEKGVKSETIVGIMLNQSLEMIIGIIGILKAGGAYLPIDPEYPKDRIKYMLNDSKAAILLTQKCLLDKVDYSEKTINMEDNILYENEKTNLSEVNKSDNLACVVYTSGSTGKPKGTLIEHRGIVRLVINTNYITINENDSILQLSNYAFIASTFDIYGALLNGAKLVLISKEDLLEMRELGNVILNKKISLFFVTPALFNVIVDTNIECLRNVKKILIGGDKISIRHARRALKYLGKEHLIQVYGQTEGTAYATYYFINNIEENIYSIPIGKPVSNSAVYIIGENNELLTVGKVGELCVSGEGLARGYLNREELTEKKFVDNPFKLGTKMYKTGDLARWLPDGNVEFLGRMDNQVKIRGFRIEVEEIENKLLKLEDIKEAIVVAKHDISGNNVLHAYVTAEREISVTVLKEELLKNLPSYMIPNYIERLEKLPLTQNKKVDRKLLSAMEVHINNKKNIAPRNDIEKIVLEAFKNVLKTESIGIYDEFTLLGGTSIAGVRLIYELNKKGINIALETIFTCQSIAKIADYIKYESNKNLSLTDRMVSNLKSGGYIKENLILLPPAGGANISYLEMAKEIKNIGSIYALQDPRLCGSVSKKFEKQNELINTYLEAINKVFKPGVDYIGGHSFGGALAFKISLELARQGRAPKGLIIIDTPPSPFSNVHDNKGLKGIGLGDEELKVFAMVFVLGNLLGISKEELEELKKLEYKEIQKYILEKSKEDVMLKGLLNQLFLDLYLNVLADNIKMIEESVFIEGFLPIPIVIFRAIEGDSNINFKEWIDHTDKECKIIDVPGTHINMIRNPNVKKFAKCLDKVFSDLQ